MAFRCTTAGTAGAEPTWPSANNATVTTGGATFTNVSGQSTYGWSAAAGNLWCLSWGAPNPRAAAGDRFFLSSDHSETSTQAYYALLGGGAFGVLSAISVNRAGSVPPVAADATSGATIVQSSGTFTIEPFFNQYWQGITFNLGGTAGILNFGSSGEKINYFKNCAFVFSTSVTTASISTNIPVKAVFDNTTVTFNNAGQRFSTASGYILDLLWINTPSAILGTVPTILFSPLSYIPMLVTCRGVDLSALTTTLYYTSGGSTGFSKLLLDSCRIASGLIRLGTAGYVNADDEVELVNCFDGTSILAERHTPAGDVTTEFATTLVGGAQDNVGLFSHKLVSSTRSDPWAMTLDSFWLDVNDTLIGTSRTATVELIASAALNNNDVTLSLEYEGTTGSSLASFSSSLASPLTPAAALATSTATWNNPPATPVAQRLTVTFVQRTAGRLRAQVRLGKPSTTLWINPQVAVT
jgi:hypothetical protein